MPQSGEAMVGEREWELIVRSEILIDAPPAIVWGYLDRLQAWKDSVASVERIEGSQAQEGSVVRVEQRTGTRIVHFTLKTLRLRPEAWIAQAIRIEGAPKSHGYVLYSLHRRGSTTLLVNDVLMRYVGLPADLQAMSLEDASRLVQDATQTKLDADHRKLKGLIESTVCSLPTVSK